ncbi:MAG: FAD-dependent oxidoreductase [Candidatus Bathyarchaeota archaeon]
MNSTTTSQSVLVIGAGIAGIQSSLDLANRGFRVYLIEREPSIGGHMAKLDKTFPTMDCAMCILAPKMTECYHHPNITIFTRSEVFDVKGESGAFEVKLLKKARYVDEKKCTACSECEKVCPVTLSSEFNEKLSTRKAIFRPFPQAVPNIYTIDYAGAPPCEAACPIHQNGQGYIALIANGKHKEALDVILRDNPLPIICGRVCTHPCEEKCVRNKIDEPLSLMCLKRFASDHVADYTLQKAEVKRKEKVAVVGSGPAGLVCAYDLNRKGYDVTIFEALNVAGGMLAVGIPEYRLPKSLLKKNLDKFKEIGIKFELNSRIGDKISLAELCKKYAAIFLAIGAHSERTLEIPGENLNGVYGGINFLQNVNLGKKVKVGKKVAVIGGGDSAIDVARTARRMGADEVKIVYRRSRAEMPAEPEEICEAENEGVKIEFLAQPLQVLGKENVEALECIRMHLGKPDKSGRRRPEPIKGSKFTIPCDMVIVTIGQIPDSHFSDVKVTANNTFTVDPVTLQASVKGIFAGGDCVTEPDTIVTAMAAGRKAALSIDRYLNNLNMYEGRDLEKPYESNVKVETEKVQVKPRVQAPKIPSYERQTFKEVNRGFTEELARKEAERCLNCGVCSRCFLCETVCEPKAIDYTAKEELVELNVASIIMATGFEKFDPSTLPEYGYGRYENVITALEFERLASASGPTKGEIARPSDMRRPKRIAFIQCVGSRALERGQAYCSSVCCMYGTKEALLSKEHDPEVQTFIFYNEIRAFGKGFQEFVTRAQSEYGVQYLRSLSSEISENPNSKNLTIWYEDTFERKTVNLEVDLVVLCSALIPRSDTKELAKMLGIEQDKYGFLKSSDQLFSPVDSSVSGIFICGYCQGPKDIPDSVAQASGASARAAEVVVKDIKTSRRRKH